MEKRYIEDLLNKLNKDYNFNLKYSNNFRMAFSHSSYTNEKRIAKHLNYERLEFLGDAVVELTTSEFLFKKFPKTSGSGIPQVKGLILGRIDYKNWFFELISKFVAGVLGIGAGLSLGREGPSVQLGSYVGYGVSKLFKKDTVERN